MILFLGISFDAGLTRPVEWAWHIPKGALTMRLIAMGLALLFSMLPAAPASARATGKVLIVVSSEGRDQGATRPGFEFDEFAQAWSIFRSNGFKIEVASPAGGRAEPDEFEADKVYNAPVVADKEAQRWLAKTKRTAAANPRDYSGIYVIGGGGAMFDLFRDRALQTLLARAFESGTVIGGVCHGPAVLANVHLSDGTPLVKGRRVTGFTNAEEAGFGKRWSASYPILLETALRKSGASFEQADVMLPHVVSDGRLVTGQNPFSTALSVEAMIRAMGKEPVARAPYPDERALLLVAKYLKGDVAEARTELAVDPKGHDAMLIGIYGTILAGGADGKTDRLLQGMELMELATLYVSSPRLELGMAEAELKLGRKSAARVRAERILADTPDNEQARKLLASLRE
jgi:putative intracellular protease/amidase